MTREIYSGKEERKIFNAQAEAAHIWKCEILMTAIIVFSIFIICGTMKFLLNIYADLINFTYSIHFVSFIPRRLRVENTTGGFAKTKLLRCLNNVSFADAQQIVLWSVWQEGVKRDCWAVSIFEPEDSHQPFNISLKLNEQKAAVNVGIKSGRVKSLIAAWTAL